MNHPSAPHASAARTPEQAWMARDYVSTVRTGCTLIRFAWGVTVLLILGMVVLMLLPTMRIRMDDDLAQVVPYVLLGLILVSALVNTIGVFMYTKGDPRMPAGESASGVRTAMRVAQVVALLVGIAGLVLGLMQESVEPTFLTGSRSSPSLMVNPLGMALGLVSGVCGFVVAMGLVTYTGWLGSRVPDEALVARARALKPLVVVVYSISLVISAAGSAAIIYLLVQIGAGPWPVILLLMALLILPIIAIIGMWRLLTRIKRHLSALQAAAELAVAQRSPML